MNSIEKSWKVLKIIEKYWKVLKSIEKCWKVLKSIEKYWKVLRSIEILEKYWKVLKIPCTQDFSNKQNETSMLKSPRTNDFSNNRKETSMLKSLKFSSWWPFFIPQFCFSLISLVKSSLALCMFALWNQLLTVCITWIQYFTVLL